MSKFAFVVSYDGTAYYGFQIQDALPTIELELKRAFQLLLAEDVKIVAAGRTDRFVHAIGQVFHIETTKALPPIGFVKGLNSYLPKDIHIRSCKEVPEDFHARFSALLKEYHYFINTKEYQPLTCHHMPFIPNLNQEKMELASQYLIGTHDFRGFASAQIDPRKDTIKTIKSIIISNHEGILEFSFIGTGFLKYQIRRMMGMLIEVGKEHFPPSMIQDLLESKDPAESKYIADGCGLYLMKVYYPDDFKIL